MPLMRWLLLAAAAAAACAAPLRPPAVPLIVQSPFASIWSFGSALAGSWTQHWSGGVQALAGLLRVDGVTYRFSGLPVAGATATQVNVSVTATATRFAFTAGGVSLGVTFLTPSMANASLDVLSRPASYITFSVAVADGRPHAVQLYFDATAELVTAATTTPVAWARFTVPAPAAGPGLGASTGGNYTAMRLGAASQSVLGASCDACKISWGYVYAVVKTDGAGETGTVSTSIIGTDYSRPQFNANGTIPRGDDPAASRAVSDKWPGVVAAWDLGNLTAAAGAVTKTVALFWDEVAVMNYYGTVMPPYWRRGYAVGDTAAVPLPEIAAAVAEYPALVTAAGGWDAYVDSLTLASTGGHAGMAALAGLVYRQVMGACTLAWHPGYNTSWWLLKEISSNGDTDTADVVYPAAPLFLVHRPELLAKMMIPVWELAAGRTTAAYTVPWAPHHLGTWPLANLGSAGQEDMPVQESSLYLVLTAAIVQRGGGDTAWLAPYWGVLQQWADYLLTELPFPGNQLSTDDFLGPSPNNTNLALLGIMGSAAYGYLQWAAGDAAGANATWTRVGALGAAWVDYAWVDGAAAAAVGGPHARLQFRGTPGAAAAGASDASWSQKYSALWLRVLGFDGVLPNQSSLLAAEAAWYTSGGRANPLGLPLDYRQDFTKGDWSVWSAVTAYEGAGYGAWAGDVDTIAGPSAASTALFDGVLRWVNGTTSNVPLSDWYHTLAPGAVAGFRARPVYGSVWAPALLSLAGVPAAAGGLGMRDGPVTHPALAAARERMAAGRAVYAAGPTPTPLASSYVNPVYGGGDAPDPGVAWDDATSAWYAATTTGDGTGYGGRFALWTSRALGTWSLVGTAFPTGWPGAPAWATGSFWAPELWRVGGSWLVYFTARHGASGQLAIGVGVSSTGAVTGPYNDVGAPLILDGSPQKYGMIDATYFRDPADNASYVVFKRDGNAVGAPTPIHWARLTDAGTALAPGQPDWHANVLITSSLPWENGIVEAPWVVAPPGGGYYLFYSGSGYTSGYALSVARSVSGNFTGPYVKLGVKLLGDGGVSGAPWQAPGHASIVAAPAAMLAGSAAVAAAAAAAGAATPSPLAPYTHAVVYHAYAGSGRSARLMLLDGLVWAPNVTGDGTVWPVMAATASAAALAGVRVTSALLPAAPSTGTQPLPFGPGVPPPLSPSPTPSSSPVVAPGCPSAFTSANTVAGSLTHGLRYVSFAQANAAAGSSTFLRHGCYWLFSMPISLSDATATQDATMVVRLGLDGSPGTVSFQSVNYPAVVLTVQPDGYLQHTALTSLTPTYAADGVTVLAPPAVSPSAATWEVIVLSNATTAPVSNATSTPEALGRNSAVVQLVTRSPAYRGQVVTLGTPSAHACGTGMTLNVRVAPRATTPTAASAWVVAAGGVAAPSAYAANAAGFYTSTLRVVAETQPGASSSGVAYAMATAAAAGGAVALSNASGLWAATAPTVVQAATAAGSAAGWVVGPPLACADVCAGGPWAPVSLRSEAASGGAAYLCDVSTAADAVAGAAVSVVVRGAGDGAAFSPPAATWLAKRANVTASAGGGLVTGWLLAPPAAVARGIGEPARLLTAAAGSASASVVVAPLGAGGLNESHVWRLAWDDGAGTALALPALAATGGALLATCPSPSASPSRSATRSASPSGSPSLQLSGTGTPSPAPTASGSATGSPPATSSGSPSITASATASASGTPSPPATRSATGSGTSSVTRSGTGSVTGTVTGTGSPAPTGSGTGSATGSVSASPPATGSGTPTPSSSAAPTRSRSQSSSETPSVSASGTGSASLTASVSATGSGSVTRSPLPTATGPGTRTPTKLLPPSPSGTRSRSASGSRSATPTATASRSPSRSRSPSGTRTPAATRASPSRTPTRASRSTSPSRSVTGSRTRKPK